MLSVNLALQNSAADFNLTYEMPMKTIEFLKITAFFNMTTLVLIEHKCQKVLCVINRSCIAKFNVFTRVLLKMPSFGI